MPNPKILVVDDSTSVRQQVAHALGAAGFDVIEAVDGVDGLDIISRSPDLAAVICDLNMPRLSGIDLLERVAAPRKRSLPILMLTTEGQPGMIQRAKQAGAKGWIIKPFKAELLVATMRKLALS